jgi:hypothetical protein
VDYLKILEAKMNEAIEKNNDILIAKFKEQIKAMKATKKSEDPDEITEDDLNSFFSS